LPFDEFANLSTRSVSFSLIFPEDLKRVAKRQTSWRRLWTMRLGPESDKRSTTQLVGEIADA
jgi:hypothetical protein